MENSDILDSPFGDAAESSRTAKKAIDSVAAETSVSPKREARLREYELTSLDKADPLDSLLALSNAGLLRISHDIEACILTTLSQSDKDLRAFKSVQNAIDTQLRVTRQIDRFAQFEQRLAEFRAKLTKSSREHDPLGDYKNYGRRILNPIPNSTLADADPPTQA